MKMTSRVSALSLLIACSFGGALIPAGGASAQQAPAAASVENAVTLQNALELAYTKNPTLMAERDNLRRSDEQLSEAYGTALPTVNLQASYTRNENVTNGISFSQFFSGGGVAPTKTKEITKPKSYSATIEQRVFTGGRTLNAIRQVKALVDVGSAGLDNVEQNVLLETVAAYMDVLTNRQVVALNETNVRVLQRQLEAAQDRFDVGEITRTDVSQAEARLSGVETALISARAQLMASEAQLTRLTGLKSASLAVPSALPQLPANYDEALGFALGNHPAMAQASASLRVAEAARAVSFGEFLPTVAVQAQWKRVEDGSSFQEDSTDRSISAVATWPIFQGGATISKNRQAAYDVSRAHHQMVETRLAIEENVTNAWNNLMSARAGIQSSNSQVSANEVALDGVRQEADVGVRTTLDVLNAEQELLDSRVTLAQAKRNETVAAFQLLSATGTLNAESMGLNVAVVNPAAPDGVLDNIVESLYGE